MIDPVVEHDGEFEVYVTNVVYAESELLQEALDSIRGRPGAYVAAPEWVTVARVGEGYRVTGRIRYGYNDHP